MTIARPTLHCAPQSFDENVVDRSSSTVHADRDVLLLETVRKYIAGELRPLVGIENLRLRCRQCPVQCRNAKGALQRNRYFPRQHIAAEPIHDRHEINKALPQANVGDIAGPNVVGSIILRLRSRYGYILCLKRDPTDGLRIDSFQHHLLHQPAYPFRVDRVYLLAEPPTHPPDSVKRRPCVLLVDQPHQSQILDRFRFRLVIPSRPRNLRQAALLPYAQF